MPWRSTIEISWADQRLEKSCATDKAGVRRWGADNWKVMKRRLASLGHAPTLKDMDGLPGRCHQLRANRAGEFAVDLWSSYRLTFVPNHDPVPTLDDRGIARDLVTKISITEVVDYHGD